MLGRGGLTAWNASHTSTPPWNPYWDVKVMVVAPAIHSGLRLAPTAEVQIILEEVVVEEEKDQSGPGLGQQRRQKMKRKSESSWGHFLGFSCSQSLFSSLRLGRPGSAPVT
ncbi:unnamed protein product [Arctogadus glacialis]